MNELRKYATFSVDLMGEPVRVNRMFSIGRARIFYKGPNPNRTIIDGEVAYDLATTIPGTPIIGLYNYDTEDFEGHGDGQTAFGFVPLDPNPTWVKVNESGKEREYLEVDVVIWDGRFEEAKCILADQKHLSMELNPATMKGTIVKRGEHAYYNITSAEFAGITVLGDGVEPCFKDAGFLQAYSNMVSAYAHYMANIQENEEGGIGQMENIEEINNVEIEEVVEPDVNAEEQSEAEAVVEEVVETEAVVDVEEPAAEEEVVEEAAEPEEQPAEDVQPEEAPADEFAKEDEEKCPECGENPCVCKASKEEKACQNEASKTYSAEEYAELESKYESLQNELNVALEALKKYTRSEKLEIINKFSTKIESEDIIADLTARVDELTKEEIKSTLGNALADQIEAEEVAAEDAEPSNFSLNINVNHELGNSAWDLVRSYKNRK